MGGTSMYGEVLVGDRGGDAPDVAQVLLTDASGRTAHAFGLAVVCEETCART